MSTGQLILSNNSVSNPQTLDLSGYMDVEDGKGMDMADVQFTNRVWARSLLKPGATLALEQLTEKELVYPLHLGPVGGVSGAPTTLSATLQFVQQINAILETPGATVKWTPLGASQATTYDVLSGQFEVAYSYWKENQHWTSGTLRIFTQPLGRTAAPRVYATASGVGPLLMISPYASSGALAITPSSSGFGASGGVFGPNGASGGVSYWGNPSLAGDAPAALQISYVGPMPNSATNTGIVPYAMVSLLPDPFYRVLVTAPELSGTVLAQGVSDHVVHQQTSVASSYRQMVANGAGVGAVTLWGFNPLPVASYSLIDPAMFWAGQHRLFAIARASTATPSYSPGALWQQGPLTTTSASAIIPNGVDWGLYDLGTYTLRASEPPAVPVTVAAITNGSQAVDVAAFVTVPDNSTWFFNPTTINALQYGQPTSWGGWGTVALPVSPWSNTLLTDDVVGDQFMYWGATQTFAPSPIGSVPSAGRITQYSRGLLPIPDPKNGLPIIAILGVAQNSTQQTFINPIDTPLLISGASWANPQNLRTFAQINVLERTRYTMP